MSDKKNKGKSVGQGQELPEVMACYYQLLTDLVSIYSKPPQQTLTTGHNERYVDMYTCMYDCMNECNNIICT